MRLWWRHFFGEAVRLFVAALFLLFALYVLIDYCIHSKMWAENNVKFWMVVHYYGAQFSLRAGLLVPFALLLSLIKTTTALHQRNEFVSLQTAGVPLKRLLAPFATLALMGTLGLYVNAQWIYPHAHVGILHFQDLSFGPAVGRDRSTLNALQLADGSKLIYQCYDSHRQQLFDSFWLTNGGDLYRIKYLDPLADPPRGDFVDHLTRTADGDLICKESLKQLLFPQMRFASDELASLAAPAESLSLTQLWRQRPRGRRLLADREAEMLTQLYAKLSAPLLCLLVLLAIIPSCLGFSRRRSVFMIYCCAILGLLSFQTAMDATVILGKNHVVNPALIIWGPWAVMLAGFGQRYLRTC